MDNMFGNMVSFNQDLSKWKVNKVKSMSAFIKKDYDGGGNVFLTYKGGFKQGSFCSESWHNSPFASVPIINDGVTNQISCCSPGKYLHNAGTNTCADCAVGRFHNTVNRDAFCKICPQNTFTAAAGLPTCADCQLHFFSPPNAASCGKCYLHFNFCFVLLLTATSKPTLVKSTPHHLH